MTIIIHVKYFLIKQLKLVFIHLKPKAKTFCAWNQVISLGEKKKKRLSKSLLTFKTILCSCSS